MKGYIYLIYNDVNNYIYIGSCINNINKRLYNHRYNKTTSLYKYINSNGNDINWDNLKIREIDFIDTDDIIELRKKEGEYIKTFKKDNNYNVINCFIAGRNDKEYYIDNKDVISSVYLRKTGKTKDQIKQYNKSTEKTYNYYKNYRDKNKDKIKSYQYEYRKNKLGQSK
jgi:hypothetical protein